MPFSEFEVFDTLSLYYRSLPACSMPSFSGGKKGLK